MRRTVTRVRDEGRGHDRAWQAWLDIQRTLPERADPSRDGLTICSVAFRARCCLELNYRLMRQLNPGTAHPTWLLLDNNIEADEAPSPSDPRFTVTQAPGGEFALGYDHALGISRLLAQVKTRFVVILDPDCFIVMANWIERVQAHMAERGLGFFGTPINPRRHNSYRYFPYMVCMFVDLARVPLRDLCFLPGVWARRANVNYRIRKALADVPKAGVMFRWLLTEQWRTNGWQIKARYGSGRDVAFECAQPVWDIDAEMARSSLKRLIHRWTPAAVSPIPKKRDYCAPHGFRSMSAPDVAAHGWEEFVWQGRPFAFHVGSVHGSGGDYLSSLSDVLDAFAPRVAGVAQAPPSRERA
jgi:hypothetical protein